MKKSSLVILFFVLIMTVVTGLLAFSSGRRNHGTSSRGKLVWEVALPKHMEKKTPDCG